MRVENVVETDVLVIGGGMAGLFTAIRAREQGVDVILADKGYAGKSGQSPFAAGFCVFNPEWGDDLDGWMNQVNVYGQYVNNREWTEICFKESYARCQDLMSWGVNFPLGEDSPIYRAGGQNGPCRVALQGPREHPILMRKQAVKLGVKIMDRVMVTDLLKQDGRIAGALAILMDSGDIYIFKAKATVICAGAGGFKPWSWPISALTFDGDSMAYRAGAAITGKEYMDTHGSRAKNPAYKGFSQTVKRKSHEHTKRVTVNAESEQLENRGTLFLDMEFQAHAGKAPFYAVTDDGKNEVIGGGSSGMSVHKAEGIWPEDTDCSTSLAGLYAAGDALGTMQVGAVYSCGGSGLMGAAVTGARAGTAAANYAQQTEKADIDSIEVDRIKKITLGPLERKGGFSPRWVTQVLQNTMMPYFVLFIKKEDRMKAALTIVEFLRDHMSPMLIAKDTHELRLALETRNMILNAEMKLKASLFRTESRGTHYREDYPRRDDPTWLAWILLKEENSEMKLSKKPVPQEWWPDLNKPYEERYPWRVPGE